jgi:hypothetical protein
MEYGVILVTEVRTVRLICAPRQPSEALEIQFSFPVMTFGFGDSGAGGTYGSVGGLTGALMRSVFN